MKTRNGRKAELNMLEALDQKRLLEKYRSLLEKLSKCDSPDSMIKQALPMSVLGLIASQFSENEAIALKARTEIINRGLGKPVERTVNIYGDIAQMNEKDLDNQILQLFGKTNATPLLSATPKQKRKPRKSEPLVIEADYRERAQETDTSAEAGPTANAEDQTTS